MAPQTITDCRKFALEFKQYAPPLFLLLCYGLPNKMKNLLLIWIDNFRLFPFQPADKMTLVQETLDVV